MSVSKDVDVDFSQFLDESWNEVLSTFLTINEVQSIIQNEA
jgi:hypothetical protein